MQPLQDVKRQLPHVIDLEELLAYMVDADLPLELYGHDGAKTAGHLLTELQEGEAVLSVGTDGKLYREVSVLWLDVLCKMSNGAVYALREDRQVFSNGTVKRRQLSSSLGEKLKAKEDSQSAVARALAEELGIGDEHITELYFQGEEFDSLIPDTYPGLETQYQFFKYATVISEQAFNPDGYIEYQADKTNYYLWEQIR